MWVPDDLDISQDEYLTLLDKDNLEVQRLISYRRQFLHFLDMLNTYEVSRRASSGVQICNSAFSNAHSSSIRLSLEDRCLPKRILIAQFTPSCERTHLCSHVLKWLVAVTLVD